MSYYIITEKSEFDRIELSTVPADRVRAEHAIKTLYRLSNLPELRWSYAWTGNNKVDERKLKRLLKTGPGFIWVKSPLAAAKIVKIYTENEAGLPLLTNLSGQFGLDETQAMLRDAVQAEQNGKVLSREDQLHLDAWDNLSRACGPVWPFEKGAIMTERPVECTETSIVYADGYSFQLPTKQPQASR